jgi:hypothetical protein
VLGCRTGQVYAHVPIDPGGPLHGTLQRLSTAFRDPAWRPLLASTLLPARMGAFPRSTRSRKKGGSR